MAIVAIVAATVLVMSMDGEQRTVIADDVVFHPQYGTEPNYDYFESETGNGVEPCIFIDAEDMKWIVTASAHFETGDGYKLDSITFSISFPDGMIFQERRHGSMVSPIGRTSPTESQDMRNWTG